MRLEDGWRCAWPGYGGTPVVTQADCDARPQFSGCPQAARRSDLDPERDSPVYAAQGYTRCKKKQLLSTCPE